MPIQKEESLDMSNNTIKWHDVTVMYVFTNERGHTAPSVQVNGKR
jgi:hypothetical protein